MAIALEIVRELNTPFGSPAFQESNRLMDESYERFAVGKGEKLIAEMALSLKGDREIEYLNLQEFVDQFETASKVCDSIFIKVSINSEVEIWCLDV